MRLDVDVGQKFEITWRKGKLSNGMGTSAAKALTDSRLFSQISRLGKFLQLLRRASGGGNCAKKASSLGSGLYRLVARQFTYLSYSPFGVLGLPTPVHSSQPFRGRWPLLPVVMSRNSRLYSLAFPYSL